ncbi:MAG: 5'-nucleotidase C-terminal domain-containing protein [Succinivibrionaceae bacterium]|nr:bifunctional metallophosphatase/5'-nucleotidase [Pseudomonadota bacterium]MDY3145579.1 5'-nucleotidase C-terminal domain-containing protein [Succinivibrionaceae bacterium]
MRLQLNEKIPVFARVCAGLLIGAACAGYFVYAQFFAEKPWVLTVFHVNSFSSRLEPSREALTAGGVNITAETGGAAILKSELDSLGAYSGRKPAILLSTGMPYDTLSPFYGSYHGEAEAAAYNSICFDALLPGREAYEEGSGFADFASRLGVSGKCAPSVLSGDTSGDSMPMSAVRYKAFEKNGRKIGVIALHAEGKASGKGEPVPADELSAVSRTAETLRKKGIGVIIIASDGDLAAAKQAARKIREADAVVSSGDTILGNDFRDLGLPSEGPYPLTVRRADGSMACVSLAGRSAEILGELRLRLDSDGNVLSCGGSPHLMLNGSIMVEDSGDKNDEVRRAVARHIYADLLKPDRALSETVAKYSSSIPGNRSERITESRGLYCSMGDRSLRCLKSSADPTASGLGTLLGKAMLKAVPEADIALLNGGALHRSMYAGPVTAGMLQDMIPEDDTLVLMDLSGAELVGSLRALYAGIKEGYPASAQSLACGSGIRFSVGNGLTLGNFEVSTGGAWHPVRPEAYYRVVTLLSLARGQHGWGPLVRGRKARDTGIMARLAFRKFLEGEKITPQVETREMVMQPERGGK